MEQQFEKQWRVKLHPLAHSTAQELALLACKNNAGGNITFEDMASLFKLDVKKYPTLNADCNLELGDGFLAIDKKVGDGQPYLNILTIEVVDVAVLPEPDEKEIIPI